MDLLPLDIVAQIAWDARANIRSFATTCKRFNDAVKLIPVNKIRLYHILKNICYTKYAASYTLRIVSDSPIITIKVFMDAILLVTYIYNKGTDLINNIITTSSTRFSYTIYKSSRYGIIVRGGGSIQAMNYNYASLRIFIAYDIHSYVRCLDAQAVYNWLKHVDWN